MYIDQKVHEGIPQKDSFLSLAFEDHRLKQRANYQEKVCNT